MVPHHSSPRFLEQKLLSLMLTYHAKGATVPQNSYTGFKACEKCGLSYSYVCHFVTKIIKIA
jgi:hypothetical protein